MLVETDIDSVIPLCCPQCGNTGENASFNARTFVLINEQGLPTVVGDYSEWRNDDGSPAEIDCHQCAFKGPVHEFHII